MISPLWLASLKLKVFSTVTLTSETAKKMMRITIHWTQLENRTSLEVALLMMTVMAVEVVIKIDHHQMVRMAIQIERRGKRRALQAK